jgi:hypothetical protein
VGVPLGIDGGDEGAADKYRDRLRAREKALREAHERGVRPRRPDEPADVRGASPPRRLPYAKPEAK